MNPPQASLLKNRPFLGFSNRPGLLVSVRSVAEAREAEKAGVDVIDIKEPDAGPLGAACPTIWDGVAAVLSEHKRLSVALGEAVQVVKDLKEGDKRLHAIPERTLFAKAGPSGIPSIALLKKHWSDIQRGLPPTVQLVGVAYADWENAACPTPEEILDATAQSGMQWWLLDTYSKNGRSVVDLLGSDRLAAIGRQAKKRNICWVLAGSLRRSSPVRWELWNPAMLGVRGDVCIKGRKGDLSESALGEWVELLRSKGLRGD